MQLYWSNGRQCTSALRHWETAPDTVGLRDACRFEIKYFTKKKYIVDVGIMDSNTMQTCRYTRKFRRNILFPSSGLKILSFYFSLEDGDSMLHRNVGLYLCESWRHYNPETDIHRDFQTRWIDTKASVACILWTHLENRWRQMQSLHSEEEFVPVRHGGALWKEDIFVTWRKPGKLKCKVISCFLPCYVSLINEANSLFLLTL
jgi:hypothetical protein